MPDLKVLKQLVRLMQEADLTELDIEQEGEKIKLKRGGAGGVVALPSPPPQTLPAAPQPTAPPAAPTAPAAAGGDAGGSTLNSPMVGTFYSSPSPDAKPFVQVGDKVGPDTLVCIIEAMKVFNEIKAEMSGTVQKVLVENGAAVEFGQPLFVIK